MFVPKKIKFRNWNCELKVHKYQNGRIALQLIDAEDGSQIAMATTNMPDFPLEDHEVCIKDYSENTGMLNTLVAAGIVKPTGRFIRSGFVQIPICELLIDPTEL